jgi:hypothetical protein
VNGLRVSQGNSFTYVLVNDNIYGIMTIIYYYYYILGKFYLVDAGYGAKPGFLPSFRGVRYHLNEWVNNPVKMRKSCLI